MCKHFGALPTQDVLKVVETKVEGIWKLESEREPLRRNVDALIFSYFEELLAQPSVRG